MVMHFTRPVKGLSAKQGRGLLGVLTLAAMLHTAATRAQPVIDQFVSNAELVTTKDCSLLRVNFHVRVRYTGHFPPDRGNQLRISLQLIDRDSVDDGRIFRREGVRVDNAAAAGIQSVALDLDQSSGPVLQIQFLRPVSYQVVQSGSFESVAVAIAKTGSAASCVAGSDAGKTTDRNSQRQSGSTDGTGASVRAKPMQAAKLSQADTKTVEASMDEARDAIKKGNFAQAIDILKKVLKYPENASSAEAQELLGVARQKAGQRAEARAEFEDYLRRYKNGEGSERVRQRLAGLLTASRR